MTASFQSSTAALTAPPPDPTKHVDYQLGMVLGVDDFQQEFAYLANRDEWALRDLVGYGTAWGLRVRTAPGANGPEVRVASGAGVTPRGRLVRVAPEQCASLDGWLAAHDAEVTARVSGSPPAGEVRLYVVLGYRDCETDDVPIPGEPCRTEDDAMKPSRVADDFLLELRLDPPDQSEEWAVRELVQWLRDHMMVTGSGSSVDLPVFLDALRQAAAQTAPPAMSWPPFSPSSSPPDFIEDASPPSPMPVNSADVPRFLRAALGVWVTELRPLWRPSWMGDAASCADAQPGKVKDGDTLLLAALDVKLSRELGGGAWKVSSAPDALTLDESARPLLFHLRLLEELLLAAPAGGSASRVVASGRLSGAVGPDRGSNNLRVLAAANGTLTIGFDGLSPPGAGASYDYLVKASVEPSAAAFKAPWATFGGYTNVSGVPAFRLLVLDLGIAVPAVTLATVRFGIEVSQFQLS